MAVCELNTITVDPLMLDRVIRATLQGFEMVGVGPVPIGASRLVRTPRRISALIGLLGDHTGTMVLNLSEGAACLFAARLLCEDQPALNAETLDAVGEIGNMVAGATKDLLVGTSYTIANISCPTVVMGASYDLYYSKGFTTLSVDFEVPEIPMTQIEDRIFSVSVSVMKR